MQTTCSFHDAADTIIFVGISSQTVPLRLILPSSPPAFEDKETSSLRYFPEAQQTPASLRRGFFVAQFRNFGIALPFHPARTGVGQ
jgi:hypothetical protein